jgi:ABC-type Fe3+ transport system substrate-binding protein
MRRIWIVGVVLSVVLLTAGSRSAQSQEWKQDWDKTVAQANEEGRLTMAIASGEVWRKEVMRFQEAYPKIRLEMTTASGRDFWPRFIKEREAGQYLWDLRVGSSDAQQYALKQKGNFQSIRSLLLLPEVSDENIWYGGFDGLFLDNEKKFFLGFSAVATPLGYFNKKLLGDSFAVGDIDDPKWAGKISLADPRGGAGVANVAVLYKRYGPDFVRKLLVDQKPVITTISRQQVEWLLSGRYPIAFGVQNATLIDMRDNGGDISAVGTLSGQEKWTTSTGGLSVPTKNPHPAATTVFVNWILTRSVQEHLMKAVELNSRRKDVPPGAPSMAVDFSTLDNEYGEQSEEFLPSIDGVQKMAREIAGN